MNKNVLNNFIAHMKETIYGAGEIALKHQGKVENIGKKTEKLPNDNDFVRQQRAAKTVIDEKVQEELLLAASRTLNAPLVYLDAEEETPPKKFFSSKPTSTSLIIDPIDGTFEYVSGGDRYGICVGLIENGIVLTSIVYFPARKEFYFIKDGCGYRESSNVLQKLSAPKVKSETLIYVNNRVGNQIIDNLNKNGFKVINDADAVVLWNDALIGCIKGEYNVCIFHSPQIRDVLMGTILSKISGGYARDWTGNEII